MSRPTKYSDEILASAENYVAGGYLDDDDVIPTKAGLSLRLDIALSTIDAWDADPTRPQFSGVLGNLMAKQHRILANKGLVGDFNSVMAKLMLTKHGYADKADNTLAGPNGGPVQITEIKHTIVDPNDS